MKSEPNVAFHWQRFNIGNNNIELNSRTDGRKCNVSIGTVVKGMRYNVSLYYSAYFDVIFLYRELSSWSFIASGIPRPIGVTWLIKFVIGVGEQNRLSVLGTLTLRLLMSYIYGAPSKARNANIVYIWTYVWQR